MNWAAFLAIFGRVNHFSAYPSKCCFHPALAPYPEIFFLGVYMAFNLFAHCDYSLQGHSGNLKPKFFLRSSMFLLVV